MTDNDDKVGVSGVIIGCVMGAFSLFLVSLLAVGGARAIIAVANVAGYRHAPVCAASAPPNARGCVHLEPASLRSLKLHNQGSLSHGNYVESADVVTAAGTEGTVTLGAAVPDSQVAALAKLPAGSSVTVLFYNGGPTGLEIPHGPTIHSNLGEGDALIPAILLPILPLVVIGILVLWAFRGLKDMVNRKRAAVSGT